MVEPIEACGEGDGRLVLASQALVEGRLRSAERLAGGAPVLVAHARRQYSALLRARGADGDWERAVALLADAAAAYRRLEIEGLATDTEALLRRCHDPGPAVTPPAGTPPNRFSRV